MSLESFSLLQIRISSGSSPFLGAFPFTFVFFIIFPTFFNNPEDELVDVMDDVDDTLGRTASFCFVAFEPSFTLSFLSFFPIVLPSFFLWVLPGGRSGGSD